MLPFFALYTNCCDGVCVASADCLNDSKDTNAQLLLYPLPKGSKIAH